jgi:oligopeptide transport system ATP-binding protein
MSESAAASAELSTATATAPAVDQPVLSVRDLVKHFPVRSRGIVRRTIGQVHAVCGVSFDLHAQETLGLVGESGCGKSTTARAVLNLQPATSGSVTYDGKEITALTSKQMRALRRTRTRRWTRGCR